MRKTFTLLIALLALTVNSWATSTVTWTEQDVATVALTCENVNEVQTSSPINGITVSLTKTSNVDHCQFTVKEPWINGTGGYLTFTSTVGDISSIVITCSTVYGRPNEFDLSTGWTYMDDGVTKTFTWAGTSSNEVVLSGNGLDFIISSIVFSAEEIEPTPVDPTPSVSTVEWEQTDVETISLNCENVDEVQTASEIEGITASLTRTGTGDYSYCQFMNRDLWITLSCGYLTFTSSVGDISAIVITSDNVYTAPSNLSSDWTYDVEAHTLTWAGTASDEVILSGSMDIVISSIEFTVVSGSSPVDPTPSDPFFMWEERQVSHVNLYCESLNAVETTPVIKNVIASLTKTSNGSCYFMNRGLIINDNGELTFRSLVGDLTGIEITCDYISVANNLSAGWEYNSVANTLTWTGTAAEEVTLSGNIDISISSIKYYYSPAAAPRLGEDIYDVNYQRYVITGAHTAKVASSLAHTYSIPEYVEDLGVTYYITEIDDYAYANLENEGYVYIGTNIAKIGAHAFDGHRRLTYASIYSTVLDTIGDAAFRNCTLMAAFECNTMLPPVFVSNVFSGDNYLNHISVHPSYVNDYKNAAGWSAYSGKINAIGAANATVGEEFFFHNQMTTGLYAVTSVGSTQAQRQAKVIPYTAEVNAIYPITREGTLVIPEEVGYSGNEYRITGIGANAFKDSARLNMVLMPQAVKSIESGAFRNCTGVEKVFFLWDDPTSVTWADGAAGQGNDFRTAASGNTKIFVPEGRLDVYKAWAPAWADCMYEGAVLDVDVSAAQDPDHVGRFYRTFYDSKTDYLLPPSVWAFAGYVSGDEFMLTHVAFDGQILPKNTPVVLESETPTYRLIPTGNTAPAYTGPNQLIGSDEDILVSSLGDDADKVYVLASQAMIGDNLQIGMGMYRYVGSMLAAHKAYMILDIPSGSNSSAPARFAFKYEQATTGVENVQGDKVQSTKVIRDGQLIIINNGKEYNAQGQIIK